MKGKTNFIRKILRKPPTVGIARARRQQLFKQMAGDSLIELDCVASPFFRHKTAYVIKNTLKGTLYKP